MTNPATTEVENAKRHARDCVEFVMGLADPISKEATAYVSRECRGYSPEARSAFRKEFSEVFLSVY